jgi:general secretion pathway protein I
MERKGEKGFTLLETLVALTVFALVAAGLQVCLSRGWSGIARVSKEKAALQLATSQLAAAGVESPLREGTVEGVTADGFAWSRDVSRYNPEDSDLLTDPNAMAGYWVRVGVSWQDGPRRPQRTLELSTLRIGRRGE